MKVILPSLWKPGKGVLCQRQDEQSDLGTRVREDLERKKGW